MVLLTLKRYDHANHVLSNAGPINDPVWEQMESIFLSWIFGTITDELWDIAKEHGVTTHQVWLTLEH
jgi:hypothetical protein